MAKLKSYFMLSDLQKIENKAVELSKLYNKLVANNEIPELKITVDDGDVFNLSIKDEIEKLVTDYSVLSKTQTFCELEKKENPMLEAIKLMFYPTIKTKKTKNDDEDTIVIVNSETYIDLLELHKHAKPKLGGIGKDFLWAPRLERLNQHLTSRVANNVIAGKNNLKTAQAEIKNKYKMSSLGHSIDNGDVGKKAEKADATSKTQIKKLANQIVMDMIGEDYKFTSHNINWILEAYSKMGSKSNALTSASHKTFRNIILRQLNAVVTKKDSIVEFDKVK